MDDRRFQVALAAMQGMLANPSLVGLDGIKESPRGVYLLDRCEQRKALAHRAVLLADDLILAADHTISDIYVTGEVRRRTECGLSPVTERFVEEVEAEVGVGGSAWDTVGARRVVEAVMGVLRRLDPRDP